MREYFCAYHSMLGAMRKLSDAECGRLFRALLKYSAGDELDNLQGREEVLFDVFSQQIDRDADKYRQKCEKNRSNVSTRYQSSTIVDERKQSNMNANERKQSYSKGYQNYQDKEKDKDKEEVVVVARAREDDNDDLLAISDTMNAAFDAAEGIGLKGGKAIEQANKLAGDYSAEWLLEAINRAAQAPQTAWCWRYIEGILRSWKQKGGIDTADKPQSQAAKKTVTEYIVVDGERVPWTHEVSL